jgi:hypothetical protein
MLDLAHLDRPVAVGQDPEPEHALGHLTDLRALERADLVAEVAQLLYRRRASMSCAGCEQLPTRRPQDSLHAVRSGSLVLQAVALLGLGVGRVQQRHAPLGPQLLDLVKVLANVGGLLG